jgi:plasmid stabilization system protein ParE
MAAKPVEFLNEASAEYEAVFDWYLSRSESSASKFALELAQAVGLIAAAPQRWSAGPHGTHAHGRRRPGYWKSRI